MRYFFLTFALILLPLSVFAADTPEFAAWKKTFRSRAIADGIPATYIDTLLPKMIELPTVVESDRKQPEFTQTFWDYMDRRLTDQRISDGRAMLKKYKTLLNQISQKYGVPPAYIVAFWGLETNYGSYTGKIDILSALATLAYDERRRTFFTNQLISFVKIMYDNNLSDVKGSWAGAFGHFQFIPTTFAAYAVDGDGDGKKDLLNSLPDAFSSAANYLSKSGWDKSTRWGREVKISPKTDKHALQLETPHSIKTWNDLGILPADGGAWPTDSLDMTAKLIMPMGIDGPLFLTYRNFDVIMKWNKSYLYALSVGLMADQIAGQKTITYAPRKNKRYSFAQAKELQQLLMDRGYYSGDIDGDFGRSTRAAIRACQKDFGIPQDGYPSDELFNKIKQL